MKQQISCILSSLSFSYFNYPFIFFLILIFLPSFLILFHFYSILTYYLLFLFHNFICSISNFNPFILFLQYVLLLLITLFILPLSRLAYFHSFSIFLNLFSFECIIYYYSLLIYYLFISPSLLSYLQHFYRSYSPRLFLNLSIIVFPSTPYFLFIPCVVIATDLS